MNIKNDLLIFILVSGMLLSIGSMAPIDPIDNPVNNIASTVNQTTYNQSTEEQTPVKVNQTKINQDESGENQTQNTKKHNSTNLKAEDRNPLNLNAKNQIPTIQNGQNDSRENQTPVIPPPDLTVETELDLPTATSNEEQEPLSIAMEINPKQNTEEGNRNDQNSSTKQTTENQTDPAENQTPTLSPADPGAKAKFDKIAATPYDEQTYNCLNKALDFHIYLLQHGATNVYLVRIKHENGTYIHAFIVWNGRAYDPTIKPPRYGADYNQYINTLREEGFTTVVG